MLQNRSHYHLRNFSFIRGISLKTFVNLDTRCALQLSSNSPAEGDFGETSTIKPPYFIEAADTASRSEYLSTSVYPQLGKTS